MIPAAVRLRARRLGRRGARPHSAEHGDDAKVLAGGQSLIPLLRLRLAYPEVLVDVGRVAELRGVREDGDHLVIGAMTTHYEVLHDPLIRQHAGLIAEATATVADPAVRHRGTFGGSLAHADPAGDLPAVALALDAEFVVAGSGGRRTVAGRGLLRRLPADRARAGRGAGRGPGAQARRRLGLPLREVPPGRPGLGDRRRRGRRPPGQRLHRRGAGSALTNMGPTPVRASRRRGGARRRGAWTAIAAAAEQAAEGTSPASDLNGKADYRQHLARVLTRRAVTAAAGGADRMQLEHQFSVPVPVAQAWHVLLDIERIAPCMPGATVESFDGETIVGRVKVKVGPIQVTYSGTARFTEKDEAARRAVIEAQRQGGPRQRHGHGHDHRRSCTTTAARRPT